ncbi:MAG: phosphatase PAP2 family protein [Acetobacter sp.]
MTAFSRTLSAMLLLAVAEPGFAAGVEQQDFSVILPSPPPPGSPGALADEEIYKTTRALKGSPRWDMAANDANLKPDAMLRDFSCSTGLALDETKAPHLAALLKALIAETKPVTRGEKEHFRRARPFVGNDLPTCVPHKENSKDDYAYPSGHATVGWAGALLLAHLVPERSALIMRRGREIGESRVVCGVHWSSDVWAGFMNGSVMYDRFETTHGTEPLFTEARKEIAALKADGTVPDQARCAAEEAATGSPLTGGQ